MLEQVVELAQPGSATVPRTANRKTDEEQRKAQSLISQYMFMVYSYVFSGQGGNI